MRWWACVLVVPLGCGLVQAEPDAADYKVEQVIPPGAESERARAQIERDIEHAARLERIQAEQAALRRAQEAAEQAQRPYPQRLLEARCTACHLADQFLNQTHTQLGWHVVVARMRILNRAPLTWQEQSIVVGELVRLRPAPAADAIIEYVVASTLLALPLALGWGLGRWKRHLPK